MIEHMENKNSADAEQCTARDKLKDELQTTWNKVRFLQMPERQVTPKLRENELLHRKKGRKEETE